VLLLSSRPPSTMTDPLAIYLHDHLAGAKLAVELLGSVREEHVNEPAGELAGSILAAVKADRATLQQLVERVGSAGAGAKEVAGWLAEKAARFKLRHAHEELGLFETFETLALGILGKQALWKALAVVAVNDARLAGMDLDKLLARAQEQHTRVEAMRLELAAQALGPWTKEPRNR